VERERLRREVAALDKELVPAFQVFDSMYTDAVLKDEKDPLFNRALQLIQRQGVDFADKSKFPRTLQHLAERLKALVATGGSSKKVLEERLAAVQRLIAEVKPSA